MTARNDRTPRCARPKRIGEAVRKSRIAASITQLELAERAGVGRRTVHRLETSGAASADSILVIATALGLSASELIPGWDASWSVIGDTPGARMRRLRRSKGLGLAAFARLLGIQPAVLSRMERGIGADLANAWLKLVSDHPFQAYLEFRTHDDLEAYLLGDTAFYDAPRRALKK